ncbi:hypothetical protein VCRA2116O30_260062 [Vibrio crassostreae]|uniref:Uncharacterized protein n=1 Tax=Vibrio crassostreae TaxID=246167 RepID=A0ABM9R0F1_9VIBR|nr:hypothetical protein VCRA2117O37_190105 [Vibrio crassostreae]CAK1840956.1 hypothetical protein VCRA2116O31_190107 [Vibrio crassostreae]CAK1941826.1 hypothetical protein VCRA2113O20_250021 [Vibrio crassostreae]CAK1947340.1 hypothetical protein VCRA2117O39_250064 [Vibrio crassostreae]CAK1968422.1 hypothetical protein VCRA2116O30_260062 [Vibrio crassostreae]
MWMENQPLNLVKHLPLNSSWINDETDMDINGLVIIAPYDTGARAIPIYCYSCSKSA